MHIEGTYTLLAPPAQVWHGMQNQQILLRTVPGIKQVEALDEHTFAITFTVNQMPFTGSYTGKVTILEQQFPYHYRIAIKSENEQRQFHGEVSIHFQDREHSTIVAYAGTLHLATPEPHPTSITLARGATKLLIQQFFTALDDQLRTSDLQDTDLAATIERYDTYSTAGTVGIKSKNSLLLQREVANNGTAMLSPAFSAVAPAQQTGIFYALVHFLKLGHGEPEQEQRWINRLRRASTISSLLLLIWIGTRLPRQRNKAQH
jgi:carbon monoxide dehydrogenase subunit G